MSSGYVPILTVELHFPEAGSLRIKRDVLRAGFRSFDVHVISREKEIPSVLNFARGLVYGNPTIDQIRHRGGVDPERVVDSLAKTFERKFGSAKATMTIQAILFEVGR